MELTNELKVERIRLQLTAKSVAEMMGAITFTMR